MAKFARETDDVRTASSLASGTLAQYLTTTLTCLALAFSCSWALTLVILSAVPALIIIQVISQTLVGPLLRVEQQHTAGIYCSTQLLPLSGSVIVTAAFWLPLHPLPLSLPPLWRVHPDEKELPWVMLALVATVIHCAIKERTDGTCTPGLFTVY
ncbi:hypothetical protein FIBSPDRAFT_902460 [Athelia psychrophila]|uniref:ABC transmembrane type-1 domain-containing protein n=1 Tax=Athelia psychrophila TaxID=1759441 RepID=A0A167X7A4_9AGAM|nr:hypothetical protein FIBSPDRAFT_902460 [Fibularhizoctonia sp. CBS 109695]